MIWNRSSVFTLQTRRLTRERLKIEVVDLDETTAVMTTDTAEVVWNEQASLNWVRQEIRAALSPEEPGIEGVPQMPRPYYEVIDVSREDTALVEEWFKGDRKRWVIPFTVGDNAVSISPATRWVEVREAMIAASDDFDKKSYGTLAVKLGQELRNMLGQVGEKYSIDQITTDGRVSVKNGDDSSVFAAEFVEFGDRSNAVSNFGVGADQGSRAEGEEASAVLCR